MILGILKFAHWTQVSNRCPLGYLSPTCCVLGEQDLPLIVIFQACFLLSEKCECIMIYCILLQMIEMICPFQNSSQPEMFKMLRSRICTNNSFN